MLVSLIGGLLVASPAYAAPSCKGLAATIVGTRRADVLRGTPKADVIVGGAGPDVIWGLGGVDTVCADNGADLLYGGGGRDSLSGGDGNDLLIGGAGADDSFGGAGQDVCGPGGVDAKRCEAVDTQPRLPLTAAFYYPWYPEGWGDRAAGYTHFHPSLGWYNGSKLSVIGKHIAAMRYAHVEAGIASWWGSGSVTDRKMPALLKAASGTPFRWSVYYEPEGHGDPSRDRIARDLSAIGGRYGSDRSFLRIDGRFVVFVWADGRDRCDMAKRWRGMQRLGAYVVLKLFHGFTSCRYQPDWWHQYAPSRAIHDERPWSVSISPGFWEGGSGRPELKRSVDRWRDVVGRMARDSARLHLITTFNEWGEGTAVESAREWKSASHRGHYLDVLHRDG